MHDRDSQHNVASVLGRHGDSSLKPKRDAREYSKGNNLRELAGDAAGIDTGRQ